MDKLIKISIILGLITQFINCTIYEKLWEGAFYHLNSLSFLLFIFSLYLTYKDKWKYLSIIILYSALHQFSEELFFDATKIQVSEYISFTILLTLLLLRKHGKFRKF